LGWPLRVERYKPERGPHRVVSQIALLSDFNERARSLTAATARLFRKTAREAAPGLFEKCIQRRAQAAGAEIEA